MFLNINLAIMRELNCRKFQARLFLPLNAEVEQKLRQYKKGLEERKGLSFGWAEVIESLVDRAYLLR